MGKNDITRRGLLHSYTNFAALIRSQAGNLSFKDEVRKQKVISSQQIGGLSIGTKKVLKLTNKAHNYGNFKKEK